MKISYQWLQDYIEEKLPEPEVLAERLTIIAYEVESSEKVGEDTVFDIDILPNRAADSLCHYGIAREVASIFSFTLKKLELEVPTQAGLSSGEYINLSVESDKCNRATKRLALTGGISEAPEFIRMRLGAVGQRSINNIVDITNFVMLEMGQPVHAFDLDTLVGESPKRVSIRGALEGEKITTLDGVEYELPAGALVIADAEKALDIAGIKGGMGTGVSESTERLMLSVCNFDPVSVRTTSGKLGLRTDASKRFENNLSPEAAFFGMQRLSFLLHKYADVELAEDVLDVYPDPEESMPVEVSLKHIEEILGVPIASEQAEEILHSLGMQASTLGGVLRVSVPTYRRDIIKGIDLVEEIGRMYGYDKIESIPPKRMPAIVSKRFFYESRIRDILVSQGFREVMTYSFQEKGEIETQNALASDKGALRTSLAPGLEVALAHNSKHADLLEDDNVKIFEIGTVFIKEREFLQLGVTLSLRDQEQSRVIEYLEETLTFLGSVLGVRVASTYKNDIALVDLSTLFDSLPEADSYKELSSLSLEEKEFEPFSRFPVALRDIAVWVSPPGSKEDLEKIICEQAGQELVRSRLFDEFEKDGRTSYAYRLVFQAKNKTLSEEDINAPMERIYEELSKKDPYEVR